MLLTTLIERKRDGEALAPDELRALLDAYMGGDLADVQMAAFLMAAFLRGLNASELGVLTRAIIESGDLLELGDGPPLVDKHSTGGVGDKVSLVLAPLLAAAGVRVPMISGRGLGHTGGTLDKLESIPGFDVSVSVDRLRDILSDVGCAIVGQTDEIAPLDGRLYALRDLTGTVPSPPLIAASIVSKKACEGISALVLDVKCGRGAFRGDPEASAALARLMVDLARSEGLHATALLTSMDAPLGSAVGNALEVREALGCLAGSGPPSVRELTLALGAELLVSAGVGADADEVASDLAGLLDDGTARARFARMIEAQGGDPRVVDDPARLPSAPIRTVVVAPRSGSIDIDARAVGLAAIELGSGRQRPGQAIDPSVGFELLAVAGQDVETDQPLYRIHAATASSAERAVARLLDATEISDAPRELPPLIRSRVA